MIELDVDCLLFFPVEGTGSNPEWGDYSVVACCCVCMHMAVFGDTFGEVMGWLSPPIISSIDQLVERLGRS